MLKIATVDRWISPLLLLISIGIGACLRFVNLGEKPPSTIELATLVFSLGHGLQNVPVDRAIAIETLLQPLQVDFNTGISDVIHHLMTESTHPPLFFILTHWWMQLFPSEGGLASIWAARSLSAIFGTLAIPAIFSLGWLAFRSRLVAHCAAALMAVSPFGIYLAQEARHYTLAILLIIASLSCLIVAARCLQHQRSLPSWIVLVWVGVNALGLAVHYFFSLSLALIGLVIAAFWWRDFRVQKVAILKARYWRSLYIAALGTLVAGLVWLPSVSGISDNELTQWIYQEIEFGELLEPLARFVAWIATMLCLLPVEGDNLALTIGSGAVLILFLVWVTPALIRGIQVQLNRPSSRLATQVFGGMFLSAIALFLLITYGFGVDLTLAARYHFVYFPIVILLLGTALATHWENIKQNSSNRWKNSGQQVVIVTLILGFLGALTVVSGQGFQKSRRSDLLVPQIAQVSQAPILLATYQKTHQEIRMMMAIALEFKRLNLTSNSPQFLLTNQVDESKDDSTLTLYQTVEQLPKPLDLWLINFTPALKPESQNCFRDPRDFPDIDGYKYRLYHCIVQANEV